VLDEALGPERRLQDALDKAYRYLGHRDRTIAEVRRHLEAKGLEASVVAATVAELLERGYLDDARFAQRYVEDRRTLDAWGSERIGRRLDELGVPAELIFGALADHGAGGELGAAVEVLRRRLRVPPASERERERALGLLVRKGYELDLAYDAVRAFERDAA
jgi:regulatory protein